MVMLRAAALRICFVLLVDAVLKKKSFQWRTEQQQQQNAQCAGNENSLEDNLGRKNMQITLITLTKVCQVTLFYYASPNRHGCMVNLHASFSRFLRDRVHLSKYCECRTFNFHKNEMILVMTGSVFILLLVHVSQQSEDSAHSLSLLYYNFLIFIQLEIR